MNKVQDGTAYLAEAPTDFKDGIAKFNPALFKKYERQNRVNMHKNSMSVASLSKKPMSPSNATNMARTEMATYEEQYDVARSQVKTPLTNSISALINRRKMRGSMKDVRKSMCDAKPSKEGLSPDLLAGSFRKAFR